MKLSTFVKFQTLKQEKKRSSHFLILTNKETQVHNLEKAICLINLSIRTNTKNINKQRYCYVIKYKPVSIDLFEIIYWHKFCETQCW